MLISGIDPLDSATVRSSLVLSSVIVEQRNVSGVDPNLRALLCEESIGIVQEGLSCIRSNLTNQTAGVGDGIRIQPCLVVPCIFCV